MITDTKFVYLGMNFVNLRDLLIHHKKITVFPLVDNPQTMTLLGSIPRTELIHLLDQEMGVANRRMVLPSPKIFREENNEEPIEIIPMRKKSHMAIIEDSSDSEKEDDKENKTNGVEEIQMKTQETNVVDLASAQKEVSLIALTIS